MAQPQLSEQRAREAARDILSIRGWNLRPVSSGGQLLEESEYRHYPPLAHIFEGKSKSGPGIGKPDFLLVRSADSLIPMLVIDTKPRTSDLQRSIKDTNHYGDACYESGHKVLSAAVAGADYEVCEVRAQKRIEDQWEYLTLHQQPIDWIPSPFQTAALLADQLRTEVEPERPSEQVLAAQANRLNEILRECKIKDEYRPVYVASFMLALWYGDVDPDPNVVLSQVNSNAGRALKGARKPELSQSLRVDAENEELASKAWQIIDILKKLNIRSFMQEHDYLGQLYETFFRYTGGNTIGQYFTPRHTIKMMCDLVQVGATDVVFDPACGTGGFLIGALNRMIKLHGLNYREAIEKVRHNLFGMESEPNTAALCVTNMILRGDGTSGILKDDCFKRLDYPTKQADCALLNPPFPHDPKKDKPASAFIDRALHSLRHKGLVASVVPYSLLVRTKEWHRTVLKNNKLLFVCRLPADLFTPYSSFDTAVVVFQKGIPHSGARVFLFRLSNDGYKVKKSAHVPTLGDETPLLLESYETKAERPEFSAYPIINHESKEWSPEAYIKGRPHKDAEFVDGLEQSIRKHAAFYTLHGHRILKTGFASEVPESLLFESKSAVDLTGVKFGSFTVGTYLSIMLGGSQEIEDLDEGNTPIVSTSEFENGVTAWRGPEVTYYPPAITVATDGSTCSSFVQEFPFYAFYKVALLRSKSVGMITTDGLYFIAYLLSRERWRYPYARKFGKTRIRETELFGPVDEEGKPDFETMAELVCRCRAFPVVRAFRDAYKRNLDTKFRGFAADWKEGTGAVSSAARMARHPSYQEIIKMGIEAVPLILKELNREPDHWFAALHTITGEDPVPAESRGKFDEMRQAWLKWGAEHGYL